MKRSKKVQITVTETFEFLAPHEATHYSYSLHWSKPRWWKTWTEPSTGETVWSVWRTSTYGKDQTKYDWYVDSRVKPSDIHPISP
jgi:hypothetical protein